MSFLEGFLHVVMLKGKQNIAPLWGPYMRAPNKHMWFSANLSSYPPLPPPPPTNPMSTTFLQTSPYKGILKNVTTHTFSNMSPEYLGFLFAFLQNTNKEGPNMASPLACFSSRVTASAASASSALRNPIAMARVCFMVVETVYCPPDR